MVRSKAISYTAFSLI